MSTPSIFKIMRSRGHRFAGARCGSVTIMFAVMATALVGVSALAIDYGRMLSFRARAQDALDASVLAGAQVRSAGDARAEAFFNASFDASKLMSVSKKFTVSQGVVSGVITVKSRNYLAGIVGASSFDFKVAAAAQTLQPGVACLLLLSPNANQALLVNGGANVTLNNCEAHSKSTASPAAIFNSGTSLVSNRICLQGTTIIDNGGVHPNTEKGCAAANDPFAGLLPTPASGGCTYNNLNFNGGTVTINPGIYCGWVNFNGGPDVTLNPGVYVIRNGGWNVNGGRWRGTNVTFYFADQSKIQFNSAVDADIAAPTTGLYAGIVMYEAPGLARSQMVFNDAKGFNLKGLFYLPSRDVTFNGGSLLVAHQMTAVFNTLILDQTRWNLTPGGLTIPASGAKKGAVLIR